MSKYGKLVIKLELYDPSTVDEDVKFDKRPRQLTLFTEYHVDKEEADKLACGFVKANFPKEMILYNKVEAMWHPNPVCVLLSSLVNEQ